jgi:hypothetical protein
MLILQITLRLSRAIWKLVLDKVYQDGIIIILEISQAL